MEKGNNRFQNNRSSDRMMCVLLPCLTDLELFPMNIKEHPITTSSLISFPSSPKAKGF